MKEMEKTKKRKERGITLIALVITIIVLLILAGVSISMLTGENGILTQAQRAKEETSLTEEKEKIQISVSGSQLKNEMKIKYEDLNNELQNQFDDDFNLTDNNDDTFLVVINSTQRMYYINEDGKVIDNDNILKIETAEELESFRDEVNRGNNFKNKVAILMNDITLTENWMPIGYIDDNNIIKFSGDFNGLNHKINNLNINNPNKLYQGLFANIGSEGKVNSITVNGTVIGGMYVGAIAGYNEGNIRNCGNETSVSNEYSGDEPNHFVGGISGYNYNGEINGSYNKGIIEVMKYSSGGITGKNDNGIIKNCYNTGNISAERGEAGGISGATNNSKIYKVYNSGEVRTLNASGCGGIIGSAVNECDMQNGYNIGQVQGKGNVGGIVGYFERGKIRTCYNKANLSSNETVGGIVGNIKIIENQEIYDCYFWGNNITSFVYNGPITGDCVRENIVKNSEWFTENQGYYNSIINKTSIRFNENIDMKSVLDVVNGDDFFVSNGDDNNPRLYWE